MPKVSPLRIRPPLKRRLAFIKPPRTHNEDWNLMVWATFKPFVLLFILLTIFLLMANMIYYCHKWSTPRKPDKCDPRICLKKKNSNETLEILVEILRNHTMKPVVHHMTVVGLFCSAALWGNFLNEFTLSHYSALGLSVVWIHDHYRNYRIILDSESILFSLAHLAQIFAIVSTFAFSAALFGQLFYPKQQQKPTKEVIEKESNEVKSKTKSKRKIVDIEHIVE